MASGKESLGDTYQMAVAARGILLRVLREGEGGGVCRGVHVCMYECVLVLQARPTFSVD